MQLDCTSWPSVLLRLNLKSCRSVIHRHWTLWYHLCFRKTLLVDLLWMQSLRCPLLRGVFLCSWMTKTSGTSSHILCFTTKMFSKHSKSEETTMTESWSRSCNMRRWRRNRRKRNRRWWSKWRMKRSLPGKKWSNSISNSRSTNLPHLSKPSTREMKTSSSSNWTVTSNKSKRTSLQNSLTQTHPSTVTNQH